MGTLAVVIALFMLMFSSELAQITFDPDLAKINGVRVHLLNLGLAVLTGATITVSMRVVGVLLVGALIVIPVLISLRITKGLTRTVITSSVVGIFVSVVGMVTSYYADIAPGGSVVLTAIVLLVLVEFGAFVRRVNGRTSHRNCVDSHSHEHESHAHGVGDESDDHELHSHR
jgi:zinc transport system permease protein